jgi:hypothetical protein
MSKYDRPRRYETMTSDPPSYAKPISGAAIKVKTLPADRLDVSHLSAISANLGTVYAGTGYFGDLSGACVAIGDKVNGFIAYDKTHSPYFVLDATEGVLSAGRRTGDEWTLTIREQVVQIHGDAVVDGTLTVGKLHLPGSLSSVLLTSDRIQVGSGTWGTDFSGFAIAQSAAGGWIGGVQSVSFDTATGHIVSVNPGGASGTYINIGSGQIFLANPRSGELAGTEYPSDIVFRSVMAGMEGDPDIITDIGLWSDGYGLNVVNLSSDLPAGLNLVGNDRTNDAKIRLDVTNGLMFMDSAGDYISFGQGTSAINRYAAPIILMTGDGDATLNLYGTHVDISGGCLQVTPCRGTWAATPAASTETRAIIHFDSVEKRWQTEIDGVWYYFNVTAV